GIRVGYSHRGATGTRPTGTSNSAHLIFRGVPGHPLGCRTAGLPRRVRHAERRCRPRILGSGGMPGFGAGVSFVSLSEDCTVTSALRVTISRRQYIQWAIKNMPRTHASAYRRDANLGGPSGEKMHWKIHDTSDADDPDPSGMRM